MKAAIVRIFPMTRGVKTKSAGSLTDTYEIEPVVPREENPKPKVCLKHPMACVYDGAQCPACQAEVEFLRLTDDMKRA